jgi:hypothetical protein
MIENAAPVVTVVCTIEYMGFCDKLLSNAKRAHFLFYLKAIKVLEDSVKILFGNT